MTDFLANDAARIALLILLFVVVPVVAARTHGMRGVGAVLVVGMVMVMTSVMAVAGMCIGPVVLEEIRVDVELGVQVEAAQVEHLGQ